jgi:putative acetyltransferase
MTRTIRLYQASDRAPALMVFYRAVREGTAAFYSEEERAEWAPSSEPDYNWPDKLLDQWCWVTEEGGRMTGFMSLRRDGELDMAFVIPEVMGDGTAAALYDVLLQQAHTEGFTRLTVRAAEQSKRFLSRRGWQFDRMERVEEDGAVFTIAILHLDLTPQ